MAKPKTKMPPNLKRKCSAAIHTATVAAGAAGATPIPVADTIPISAAQITMVIALGKIFNLTISNSVAKSVIGVGLAQKAGHFLASSLKAIPGIGTVIGGVISAATAASLTEALGWLVADDFYRISIGKEPENITEAIDDIRNFKNTSFSSPHNRR